MVDHMSVEGWTVILQLWPAGIRSVQYHHQWPRFSKLSHYLRFSGIPSIPKAKRV